MLPVIRIATTPVYLYLDAEINGREVTFRRHRVTGVITRSRGNHRWTYVNAETRDAVLATMTAEFLPEKMWLYQEAKTCTI